MTTIMKKYIFTILVALLAVFAVSCQKTSEGVTHVGSYFQTLGANTMFLGVGDEFTDPGYTELPGGGTVTTTIYDMNDEVVDAVSTAEPGFYSIVYSTTNDQGFYFEKTRMVYIYDATVAETLGTFVVDGSRSLYKDGNSYSTYAAYYADNGRTTNDSPEIVFTQVAGNIYTCSDLLGGWYTSIQGRGPLYVENYGADYATYFDMSGYVTLNADMTVTLMSSYIRCWGDGLDYISNAVYDPETKSLSYHWSYADGAVKGYAVMVQK